jgi:hypothetical protein
MTDFVNARALSAQELERLSDAVAGSYYFLTGAGGVVSEDAGGASMTVDITALTIGSAVIDGTILAAAVGASSVTLDAADATSARRDAIWVDAAGNFGKTTGTAVAEDTVYDVDDEDTYVIVSPQIPALNADEILLAEVYVGAGVTSVTDSEITDKRQFAPNAPVTLLQVADQVGTQENTTLEDSDTFTFTAQARGVYKIRHYIKLSSGATPDYKFNYTKPAGATLEGVVEYYSTTGSQTTLITTFASDVAGGPRSTPDGEAWVDATLVISTTAGEFTFTFAQNTSDASATDVKAGSWMTYEYIGAV